MTDWRVDCGDCLDLLKAMPDCSVDACVTDAPYGLSFMGKKWDYDVPSVEVWAECLRVLKPGGHLLAFAGTRTQHRMAVRIEDAGFEIRDMIAWVYGSGFPKSLDVSKAIDKAAGAEREVVGPKITGDGHIQNRKNGTNNYGTFKIVQDGIDMATAPATPAARQWQGWGTALKPALEPITMARKPFPGTVAANVMQHGTGAVNVDGCRVGTDDVLSFGSRQLGDGIKFGKCKPTTEGIQNPSGRWPANLIHDGSDEVLAGFPQSSVTGKRSPQSRSATVAGTTWGVDNHESTEYTDSGSAARFFYVPKCSKADRDGSPHPTMKPTALMQYLCRLVTPPGGTVLDPFTGSGSTGKAAMLEGFNFIGFEREAEYVEIARRRIAEAAARPMLEGIK